MTHLLREKPRATADKYRTKTSLGQCSELAFNGILSRRVLAIGWAAVGFYRRAAFDDRPTVANKSVGKASPHAWSMTVDGVKYLTFHRQLLKGCASHIAHLLMFYGFFHSVHRHILVFFGT